LIVAASFTIRQSKTALTSRLSLRIMQFDVELWSEKQAESGASSTWEIIADNLHDAGFSLGWVSAVDRKGRTIWIADAHRDDGKRFIVRADEKLTAFLEPGSGLVAGTP